MSWKPTVRGTPPHHWGGCFPATECSSHCRKFLYIKMKPFLVQLVPTVPSPYGSLWKTIYPLCRYPLITGKLWWSPLDPSPGGRDTNLRSFPSGQVLQPFSHLRDSPSDTLQFCPCLSWTVRTRTGDSTPSAVLQVPSGMITPLLGPKHSFFWPTEKKVIQ